MFLFVTALQNLAETLKLRKKFQPAEAALRESLEIQKRVFGHNHQQTAAGKFAVCLLCWMWCCVYGRKLTVG